MSFSHYFKLTTLIIRYFSVLLLGLIILPIALIFIPKEAANLPKWLYWWDNPKYGINGNNDWIARTPFGLPVTNYLSRLFWLIRNPVGGFNKKYLSISLPKGTLFTHTGDNGVGDKVKDGYSFIEADKYFELYHVKTWCSKFELVRRIGWKLHGNSLDADSRLINDIECSFVFRINPFKKAHK